MLADPRARHYFAPDHKLAFHFASDGTSNGRCKIISAQVAVGACGERQAIPSHIRIILNGKVLLQVSEWSAASNGIEATHSVGSRCARSTAFPQERCSWRMGNV